MASVLRYYRTAERPDIRLWLLDDDGALVDFASGYTFTFKLGSPGSAASFTKTTGITGAAGAGTETSGTPNVTLTFTAAELDGLTAGTTTWQLRATTGGLDRVYQGQFALHDVIT
jgi:hypothetical protein